MKMIMAVIQPHKLDSVREELGEIGVTGMTVTEVKGFGRQKGHTEIYRGAEYTIHYLPKIKIEIGVTSDIADKAVETIRNAAGQDKIGDGKIFVYDINSAVRIRTGESGDDAL